MVKAPIAGRVKTRLAREIGAALAAHLTRLHMAALLDRVGRDRRWETWLAVAPDLAATSRFWPSCYRRVPQGSGDLGARMQRVMDRFPPGPVIIIGSDIAAIQATDIARAFASLGHHDAVFGPAEDGGYWLVGCKRFPRVLRFFGNVRWSSPHTLADTLANLQGHRTILGVTLPDFDDAASLARCRGVLGRRCQGAGMRSLDTRRLPSEVEM